MSSTHDLKKRIKSVKNIAQITKAMEVVSMTKMRRSQIIARSARPFVLNSLELLDRARQFAPEKVLPALMRDRKVENELIVLVTTSKGLVGGFNEALFRLFDARIKKCKAENIPYSIIAVGKKGEEYCLSKGIAPMKLFLSPGDSNRPEDRDRSLKTIIDGFDDKKWDRVTVVYTQFVTTLKQQALQKQLLPLTKEATHSFEQTLGVKIEEKEAGYHTYTFEPEAKHLLDDIAHKVAWTLGQHVMMESGAAEHSARMVTMKSASDNASDLKQSLSIKYNNLRQSMITAELSEIIGGAEALE
jgi:F-type H+-transporting ATPase subunit gamma